MEFKDYFSKVSEDYARFRPMYPSDLFQYLASIAPRHLLAWDCGTGSGQAARGLVEHFDQVIASDASSSQISKAANHPRIQYRVMAAERTDLEAESVDLITVGQALHWFDIDAFYAEANRTLRPGGALAVWAYGFVHSDQRIHDLLVEYFQKTVGEFWPPEREKIDFGYKSVHFPFEELEAPSFSMTANWTLKQLKGYLGTWSASLRYKEKKGVDPVNLVAERLANAWGDAPARELTWPIHLRVGRKEGPGNQEIP